MNASDLYRVLLFQGLDRILLGKRNRRFFLPALEVLRGERFAPAVNAAVLRQWRLSAYCLFRTSAPATGTDHERVFFQVMDMVHAAAELPGGFFWSSLSSLDRFSFESEEEFDAVVSSVKQMEQFSSDAGFAPFGRRGWMEELLHWVRQATASFGVTLSNGFQQLNASPYFALLRLETNQKAVWFKATGEPNRHELDLSETLSHLFPEFVPAVLAAHRAWNGWLAWDGDGRLLASCADAQSWKFAAAELARFQVASLGREDDLLRAGAKDMRTGALLRQVGPFIAAMKDSMALQQSGPPPMTESQLDLLGEDLVVALERLEELQIPTTVGHLDFNPGNILVAQDRCTFLDWAEGCVGNPFLTLEYLRLHCLRSGADRGRDSHLVQNYIEIWRTILPAATIREALTTLRPIAVFAFAIACFSQRPIDAANLRSLTRRLCREMRECAVTV